MPFQEIIIEIGLKMIATFILILISSIILKNIITFIFKLYDNSFSTASVVSLWVGVMFFIASFFTGLNLLWLTILFFILINTGMVFLVRRYYKEPWQRTLLIWLCWIISYIIVAFAVSVLLFLTR